MNTARRALPNMKITLKQLYLFLIMAIGFILILLLTIGRSRRATTPLYLPETGHNTQLEVVREPQCPNPSFNRA